MVLYERSCIFNFHLSPALDQSFVSWFYFIAIWKVMDPVPWTNARYFEISQNRNSVIQLRTPKIYFLVMNDVHPCIMQYEGEALHHLSTLQICRTLEPSCLEHRRRLVFENYQRWYKSKGSLFDHLNPTNQILHLNDDFITVEVTESGFSIMK